MDVLKICCLCLGLTGCQLGYVLESAYYQADLLQRRVAISTVLKDSALQDATRKKLLLAQDARLFAEDKLGLRHTQNYTTFVKLDRPYVTYAVNAAPRTELKNFMWSFPIVGQVPYLGFFREDKAQKEAQAMKEKGYDSFVRGVTAYSTLGWFRDPVLSTMMQYEDYDLVNTIIHETVHATLYIKSSADFNEQLATFIGNRGSELFYRHREGELSATLAHVKLENEDDRLFSEFIRAQIEELTGWYQAHGGVGEEERKVHLRAIQAHFKTQLEPSLKTKKYLHFTRGEMNNARLLLYQTYLHSYDDFEKAFAKLGHDFHHFIEFCKRLESETKPDVALSQFAK